MMSGNLMKRNHIIATLVTVSIIILLFFAGPAQAFVINLIDFNNVNPERGTIVNTNIELKILSNENMPLPNPAKVYIDNVFYCSFNVSDTQTTCSNMIIKKVTSSDKSYGYGYQYGTDYGYGYQNGYSNTQLNFTLAFNTTDLSIGAHEIKITLDVGGDHIYSSDKKTITVKAIPTQSNSGSSRVCLTNFTCSSWSACNNGTQTRTCIKDKSYCYAKPLSLKQNCSISSDIPYVANPELLNLFNQTEATNNTVDQTPESKGFFSGLSSFFRNFFDWLFRRNSGSTSR